jgi:alkaline phosphatase
MICFFILLHFTHSFIKGKSTGVVTNTRITHATPASAYAHSPQREWEGDVDLPSYHGNCKDMAYQLIVDNPDIQVRSSIKHNKQRQTCDNT